MTLNFCEPAANFIVAHRSFLEAVADAAVAREIVRGETWIGLVPGVRRNLMAALEALELLLAPSPLGEQPVRAGITNRVGKSEVQPEARLVDEIVHVCFVAAVVIAAKEAAAPVIEIYPVGEVNRADAAEAPMRADMSSNPIKSIENRELKRAAKTARLG